MNGGGFPQNPGYVPSSYWTTGTGGFGPSGPPPPGYQNFTQNPGQQQWGASWAPGADNPANVAQQLGSLEQGYLKRQAPGISEVETTGLDAARANQMQALGAQQAQLNGPSLAGMQANQAFGQARAQMGGASASNPLAMRNAMLSGNQGLGGIAQAGGQAVGSEYATRLGALAGATGQLGQSDLASQNAMQQLAQQQQQLYLKQRQMNEQAAQGAEQNYFGLMSTQQQIAAAAAARGQQKQQATDSLGQQIIGASTQAAGAGFAAGSGSGGRG